MTNAQIILNESINLMKQGVLKGTGQYITVENKNGEAELLEMPEEIHTFNGWKERGFSVKKGEKSKIKFSIWKYTTKKLDTNTESAELNKMNEQINQQGGQSNMFMKTAAFFTAAQVQPIEA